MAVNKPPIDVLGTQAAPVTIAAAASSTSTPGVDISTFVGLLVGMEVTFGATPDGNTLLEVQGSPNNANFVTVPWAQFEIDFATSVALMKDIRVGPEMKYFRVKVTNNDSTDSVTVWVYAVEMGV